MYDFEIIFTENRSHPLYPLCVWACNNDKQLVWTNFLYVSDSWGETYVVFFFFVFLFFCVFFFFFFFFLCVFFFFFFFFVKNSSSYYYYFHIKLHKVFNYIFGSIDRLLN